MIFKLRQERHLRRMANTYTQIYLHVVFAVEGRQSLIKTEHNDELQKYITGIVSGQKQKLIAINNMPDHLHLLVGIKPDMALSDLRRGCTRRGLKKARGPRVRWLLWVPQ